MTTTETATGTPILDVLIIGAGLSGIGAAHQLQQHCPEKRYVILEARDSIGGTWDLFRYPGIRSDSDMYTLGYRFKPWTNPKAIADGPSILAYIRETAAEGHVTPHIRFGHKALSAAWSSSDACWSVVVARTDTGEQSTIRARFLYGCSGYYSYDEAYRPEFPDEAAFKGVTVIPQFWPKDLDYRGKQIVVIGSGATAVTVVPAMAETAAHVTMLQRSPSYVVSRPSEDIIAHGLRSILPARLAYALTRWKNVFEAMFYYKIARSYPAAFKQRVIDMASRELTPDFDVATHFTPNYNPWDQRLCAVPDGDLFGAIRKGQVSVVTDTIASFTPDGIRLQSGKTLTADVIVIATGLKLKLLGGMSLTVDGKPVIPNEAMVYKGMMLSDVPNFALAFGYTNSSWTLKADLTTGYVCRLLKFMDKHGKTVAVPRREADVAPLPFMNFTSGYVQRAEQLLPRQGSRRPWQVYQNYLQDLLTIRYGRIDDGVMQFKTGDKQ
ncbi:monooxygenase [Oxalobacteraceae bacterium GrIS 2.11]